MVHWDSLQQVDVNKVSDGTGFSWSVVIDDKRLDVSYLSVCKWKWATVEGKIWINKQGRFKLVLILESHTGLTQHEEGE